MSHKIRGELIPDEIVESVKRNTSIIALVRKHGIKVVQKGKSHLAVCPFHPDTQASMSLDTKRNLFHCLACNASGNVIQFVMEYEKVTFPEAIEKLLAVKPAAKEEAAKKEKETTLTPPAPALSTAERTALLERIVEQSVESLRNSDTARRYLENRGLDPLTLLESYTIGYHEPEVFALLAETEHAKLETLGIATDGRSLFAGCLMYPTRKEGRVATIYGRKADDAGVGRHYLLPGKREGLFLPAAGLNPQKAVVLTESIIDALSLFVAGITNVLPLLGVNGFLPDHLSYLKEQSFNGVYIALDGDQAGNRAAAALKERLAGEGIPATVITLPENKDLNDLLRERGAEGLRQWMSEQVTDPAAPPYTISEDDDYLYILFDGREYRIRVQSPHAMDNLRVGAKVYYYNRKERFHIDTLDLYQNRGRSSFISQTAEVLDCSRDTIIRDVNTIITILEERRLEARRKANEPVVYQLSDSERAEALEYLKKPKLLERIADDFAACGMIGNRNNCLLAYMISLSRLLPTALGGLIVSRSGAGKTFMQDMVASFCPEERRVELTRMTGQSLFYESRTGLKHKLLSIEEDEGMKDGMYAVRTLLTRQRLQIRSVGRDTKRDDRLGTFDNTVEGPVSVLISSTNFSTFNFETANRFFVMHLDESPEQTRKILAQRKRLAGVEGLRLKARRERIEKLHANIQRLLKSQALSNAVDSIGIEYPPELLNARRESEKFDILVKTVALLHQYQRPLKEERHHDGLYRFLEVTSEDIEAVMSFAGDILSQSISELPKLCRELLVQVHALVDEKYRTEVRSIQELKRWQVTFTRKEIKDRCGWSRWHVEEHLKELVEAGYISPRMGRKGQRYAYCLVEESIPALPVLRAKAPHKGAHPRQSSKTC
ncbi:MAG: toprim domain-containing protein [Chitinivibrionales bacterium]|nr:toprim domain-containing protein [Chitinivibrionales bacterium]